MKKTYHTLRAILLFVCVTLCASCVEEYEYEPASLTAGKPETEQAFLLTNSNVIYLENSMSQTLEVNVVRPDKSAAGSIKLVSDNDKFKVPQSIDFKAGEKSKLVKINFDMKPTTSEQVTIKVADENAYNYASTKVNITVNRYTKHSANWQSWFYDYTFKDVEIMECPKNTFTIRGQHFKANWIDSDLSNITFWKDEKGFLHMKPQYIHRQNWNDAGLKDFWIVGLWFPDSGELWKKSDIDALTKDECGKYHPEDDTFELWFHWYSPDFGWWINNQQAEWIGLLD